MLNWHAPPPHPHTHTHTHTLFPRVLQVWRVASGEVALTLHQKSFTRDAWPSVHFAADESLAAHMVGNAVNIYAGDTLAAGGWVAAGGSRWQRVAAAG